MKSSGITLKSGLAGGLLVSTLVLAGCGDDMLTSDLRVIHASKDAPPVNVRVGNKNEITELDYAESSGYVSVRAGIRKLAVEAIIPGGNASPACSLQASFQARSSNGAHRMTRQSWSIKWGFGARPGGPASQIRR